MENQQQEKLSIEKTKPNAKYASFIDAHDFARSLQLKSRKEWRAWAKGEMGEKPLRPNHVPAHPDGIYKVKGWQGWKHWLGTADKSFQEKNSGLN